MGRGGIVHFEGVHGPEWRFIQLDGTEALECHHEGDEEEGSSFTITQPSADLKAKLERAVDARDHNEEKTVIRF